MRVLVTGSTGRIGSYVVADLISNGHSVTACNIVSSSRGSTCPFLLLDLTRIGDIYQALALSKAQAVIHMGAWANAGIVPDAKTYADNMMGTFNLFQACVDSGISRVISASSAQVYGFAAHDPAYLPVDEAHPLRPANCYALSKVAGEEAAAYFGRERGLPIASFRFMGIRRPSELASDIARVSKKPASGASLLWTRTDVRDAARACRLAIEVRNAPVGPFNVTGSDIVLEQPTLELIQAHYAPLPEMRSAFVGRSSPMSCAKAATAFGYEAELRWSVSQHHPE